MKRVLGCLTVAVVLCAGVALADEPVAGQGWSVTSGKTVGDGNTFLHVQGGWPGLSAGLLHGINSTTDIGGRFSFNYGLGGDFSGELTPSLQLQGLSRITLLDTAKYNLGLEFNPGLGIWFFSNGGGAHFGLTLPVNLVFGIPVSSSVMATAGIDLPLLIIFADSSLVALPILFGGGFEYYIDQNMAFTFKLRMGPFIGISNSGTDFAADILAGIAIRM
jgi:hypothetical protein